MNSEIVFNSRTVSKFWSKIDKNGPLPDQAKKHYAGLSNCWLWLGSKFISGYGRLICNGKIIRAHRFSWGLHNNTQPNGLVLHKCDNPICVNPSHLFLGDAMDNNKDMISKGRRVTCPGDLNGSRKRPDRVRRGSTNGTAKLTEESVRAIKSKYISGCSQQMLARMFGVSRRNISMILNNKRWRHVSL